MSLQSVLAVLGMGPTELIIILVIVIVIFGAGKITGVGKALGEAIREFRHASEGTDEEKEEEKEDKKKKK